MENLPFSQSCENNKDSILEVLRQAFRERRQVLEIASGTGQHACYFASQMAWLQWQPTELPENLHFLRPRCQGFSGDNLLPVSALDVRQRPWPIAVPDALFTANSLHIMAFGAVEALFQALGQFAATDTMLAIYGPFNYGGQYTSASNARFDQWLAQQHPDSAIRHFEDIERLATAAGMQLLADHAMPANNRLLLWQVNRPRGTSPAV